MSNLFDLPPEEFSFYLEEGQYTPERRRELIEGYNAAFAARNARPPVPEGSCFKPRSWAFWRTLAAWGIRRWTT
jgi:hypothetical protein